VIWEEAFSRAFDLFYELRKHCVEAGRDCILSDGTNKYFLSFMCGFYGLSLET
jgi:hypothetical protein